MPIAIGQLTERREDVTEVQTCSDDLKLNFIHCRWTTREFPGTKGFEVSRLGHGDELIFP